MASIVLITGVFDILHQEHLNFLQKARRFADDLNKRDGQLGNGLETKLAVGSKPDFKDQLAFGDRTSLKDQISQPIKQNYCLLLGIESDLRVKQLKGVTRPINSQQKRQRALEKLNLVDEVFILPEKFASLADHRLLLSKLRPAYLLVSSHTPFLEVKKQLLAEVGGKVKVIHQHNPEISTSKIIEQR